MVVELAHALAAGVAEAGIGDRKEGGGGRGGEGGGGGRGGEEEEQ